MKSVGVAGCGAMGLPMARALVHAGYPVQGFDVRPAAQFGDFQTYLVADAHALCEVDVLICVVRDAAQILDLCFVDQAIFKQLRYPPVLIVSSTVSPRFIAELRTQLPADVALIDAPMSGAPIAAEKRLLSFMLGGDAGPIKRCMPLFSAMGKDIFTVGRLGQGMAAKVFNNYVAATSVVAVRHAVAMASEWGLAEQDLLAILSASSGANWYAKNLDQISWGREGYSPTNTLAILIKDVTAALDAASPPGEHGRDFADKLLESIAELPALPDR